MAADTGSFSKLIHKETGLWSDCYDPFYQPDGNAFKFPSKYSLITAFEVLEHIYDPNTAFATSTGFLLTAVLFIFNAKLA